MLQAPRGIPAPAFFAITAAVVLGHLTLLEVGSTRWAPRRALPQGVSALELVSMTVHPAAATHHTAPAPPVRADRRTVERAPESAAMQTRTHVAATAVLPPASPGEAIQAAAPDPAPPRPEPNESAAAALAGSAFVAPASTRIRYQVRANRFPFSMNAELVWQRDASNYEARLAIGALGLSRAQGSRGSWSTQGLAPLRFSDKFRSEVAAHFNRELGKVTFSANTPDVILQARAQDRLSVIVQLWGMVGADPARFTPGTTLSFQTVGPRDADLWLFTVESEEKLMLPGGEVQALKLVRTPQQEYGQKMELWLACAQACLPVRIRLTESNGDYLDQQWVSSEPIAADLTPP